MLDPEVQGARACSRARPTSETGPLSGKLTSRPGRPRRSRSSRSTAEADRKLVAQGEAHRPDRADPPGHAARARTSAPIHLNDRTRTQFFQVSNVGVGTLSGMVTFLDGSDPDFVLPGATQLRARSRPATRAGQHRGHVRPRARRATKSASLRFGVDARSSARQVVIAHGTWPELAEIDGRHEPDQLRRHDRREARFEDDDREGDEQRRRPAHGQGHAQRLERLRADARRRTPCPSTTIVLLARARQEKDITIRFTLPTAATGFSNGTLNLTGRRRDP